MSQTIGTDGPSRSFSTRAPADALWVLLPLAIYAVHVALFSGHVNDDAFITYRYSWNLGHGRGPYFNPGEAVEGYTNFLLMLLLAPVAFLNESAVPVISKGIGVLGGAMALVAGYAITWRLAAPLPRPWRAAASVTAMSLVALFPGVAVNATSGLETGLFAGLITGAVWFGLRSMTAPSALLWAAAALTRTEAAAVFAVWWIVQLVIAVRGGPREGAPRAALSRPLIWRPLIASGLIVGGAVVSQLVFRYLAYDGELLPNTFHAKIGGATGHTAWEYIRSGALAPFLGVAGVIVGLIGTWWRLRSRELVGVSAVALAGSLLPLLVGSDWMPGWRFSVPYLALLGAVVVGGWFALVWGVVRGSARGIAHARWVPIGLAVVCMVTMGAIHAGERGEVRDRISLRAEGYRQGHEELAAWIREGGAAPGSTVALMDIGIVGYRCPDHRILDITGLTDRTIARSPGSFLNKVYDPAYILDQEPELIVLVLKAPGGGREPLPAGQRLGGWTDAEQRLIQHPEFREHYRQVRESDVDAASWVERLAGPVGAERIYEHLHPEWYYLLAVFRRQG